MRLTEICNRLPSRAPHGLFGSWSRPAATPHLAVSRGILSHVLRRLRVLRRKRGERWLTLGLSLAAARLGSLPSALPE